MTVYFQNGGGSVWNNAYAFYHFYILYILLIDIYRSKIYLRSCELD